MSDTATGSRGLAVVAGRRNWPSSLAVVAVEADLAEAVAVAAREITPPDKDERTER
jgi:hypothetical protein